MSFPEEILTKLIEIDNTIPTIDFTFAYGTAGFRYKDSILDKCSFRAAIFTSLLSMSKNSLPHGIMITASHNPYQDNGIKISGDRGVMITPEEEEIAVEIVNSKSLKETLLSVIKKLNITQFRSIIVLAHDTRRSSPKLSNLMKKALDVLNCEYKFYDIVTTPCLQFLNLISILAFEKIGIKNKMIFPPVDDYWTFLSNAYKDYNNFYAEHFCEPNRQLKKYDRELCIDCSCGIAAVVKENIKKIMESNSDLKISFINFDTSVIENLNAGCGAENTQKMKEYPLNKKENSAVKNLSFDGDVDRVVYYKYDPNITKNIPLIDGDRILVMYGTIIYYFISLLSENLQKKFHELISIGLVITSYANGSVQKYIKEKLPKIHLEISKSGVKNAIRIANQYDLSSYFESNGHGTIHAQHNIQEKFDKLNSLVENSKDSQVLELMQKFIGLFNTTTGDAISSLLGVESVLKTFDWSVDDALNLYPELPAINTKVQIKDKSVFKCDERETKLVQPEEFQKQIEEWAKLYENGRVFVRASGTEDVVRIYCEADTMEHAEDLVKKTEELLKNY